MATVLSTDSRGILYLNCDPLKQKKIVFEGSSLKIIMGSQVLDTVDLSSIFHVSSENGGSFVKRLFISAGNQYALYGGNIAQDQGEVSLIVIKVKYDKSLEESQKLISMSYLGKTLPIKNMTFLTGKTLDHIKHHGWDLEPYGQANDVSSPVLSPMPTSPDFTRGGIIINNLTTKEIEVEILVMN